MLTSKRISLLTFSLPLCLLRVVARCQSSVTDDTYILSGSATNHGTATTLIVKSSTGTGSNAAESAFIRFDLSALPTGFAAASVQKATLKLFVDTVTTAGSIDVCQLASTPAWTESGLNGSNAANIPACTTVASPEIAVAISTDVDSYVVVDVTPIVKYWLSNSGSNNGYGTDADRWHGEHRVRLKRSDEHEP